MKRITLWALFWAAVVIAINVFLGEAHHQPTDLPPAKAQKAGKP